jgi:hypothetical protein
VDAFCKEYCLVFWTVEPLFWVSACLMLYTTVMFVNELHVWC